MRTVVGGVHDDGVLGDAELVEQIQQAADGVVVIQHRVVVARLPAPGAADALGLGVGAEMHVRGVEPHEERRFGFVLALDEIDCGVAEFVVAGFHPLLGQRAGVLDALGAVAVGPGVQHAAGPELLPELRILRIVGQFGFLFGVEVIQVAEELVEAVHRGQVLVAVAQVVLAELAGGVALRLQRRRDRRVLRLQAQRRTGQAHLGQAGAIRVLAGDERCPSGGATLLPVVVGEQHPFRGDAVDVGGSVSHQPVAVATEVALPDVVAPDDQDIRLIAHWLAFRGRSPDASPPGPADAGAYRPPLSDHRPCSRPHHRLPVASHAPRLSSAMSTPKYSGGSPLLATQPVLSRARNAERHAPTVGWTDPVSCRRPLWTRGAIGVRWRAGGVHAVEMIGLLGAAVVAAGLARSHPVRGAGLATLLTLTAMCWSDGRLPVAGRTQSLNVSGLTVQ